MNWKFWEKSEKEKEEPENLVYQDKGVTTSTNRIYFDTFDGEKTPGELGNVYDTLPDHLRLRLRAYDMNLKIDTVRIIAGKFFKWVIGNGLKLQAEPKEEVLKIYGIDFETSDFQKRSENLFELYSNSKYSDYHRNDNLHEKAKEAFQTAFLGGDCLCVARIDKFGVNVQVIDGEQIENPFDEKGKPEKNKIRNGVEINERGQHVAFWVRVDEDESSISHKRVKAYDSNGRLMAWMVYGIKHRIDHSRGIPVISAIMEKISKLDRYTEASVSKAEQTANVVYFFTHNEISDGENILDGEFGSKKTVDGVEDKDSFELAGKTLNQVKQSTSGQVYNMPRGADVKSLSSQSETQFGEFHRSVFNGLCAAVDIPPEVAMQLYEQNYSSSRAAINSWEHILDIYRKTFSKKFYDPIYRLWLEYNILTEKIEAPGFKEGDFMVKEAYFSSRFTGKKMPHIDPLKEAKAIREMLGTNTPLISHEQASEMYNVGDWSANYMKFEKESKKLPVEKTEENGANENKDGE